MITYIRYPVKKQYLQQVKVPMFCIADKIEKIDKLVTCYPKTDIDKKGNVSYPPENKIGFYCKGMRFVEIYRFKGGFNIERADKTDLQKQGREWYFSTNQKLPRKIKKQIIGTIK